MNVLLTNYKTALKSFHAFEMHILVHLKKIKNNGLLILLLLILLLLYHGAQFYALVTFFFILKSIVLNQENMILQISLELIFRN